jgi:fibronectin type 3 domain-containing protein
VLERSLNFCKKEVCVTTLKNPQIALIAVFVSLAIGLSGCVKGDLSGNNVSPSPTPSPTPQPSSHSVEVLWDASSSNSLQGYKVYRGQVSGGPYTSLSGLLDSSVLQFADSNVNAGQTYFYVVTSVDVNGSESAQSSEVSISIPAS